MAQQKEETLPFKEKAFASFQFLPSKDIVTTERETYDALNLFGDLGGLIEVCRLISTSIVAPFAALRLKALFTNRLFHLSDSSQQFAALIKADARK